MDALIARARALLQGETLRAITYGAIAVVWLVTHAAFALGVTHQPGPDFDLILAAVSGAVALLNEAIRLYVVSPATLAAVVAETVPDVKPAPVVVLEVPAEAEPAAPPDAALDPAPAEG